MKTIPFQALEPALYRETVRRALAEDLGWGDVTTDATVAPSARQRRSPREIAHACWPGSTWPPRRFVSSIPAARLRSAAETAIAATPATSSPSCVVWLRRC